MTLSGGWLNRWVQEVSRMCSQGLWNMKLSRAAVADGNGSITIESRALQSGSLTGPVN